MLDTVSAFRSVSEKPDQAQDASSIEQQVHRCREFAARHSHDVVAVYADAAQSGRSLYRQEMQRLLRDVQNRRQRLFDAVLVDDLSRLSRDMVDTVTIIFRDLPLAGVKVLDRTTGMFSDAPGARTMFGTLAMVNDAFLQAVRSQTHRGLAERARNGFWTGGRVYGYRTVQESQPADPEHPRHVPVLHPEQAEIVRRIFREYIDGRGLTKIAALLNTDGVSAPFDGHPTKKRTRGWSMTTIRAILRNEKYVGRWAWNRRQWISVSGSKFRRPTHRGDDELVVRELPELAIVSREVWDAAAARQAHLKRASRGRQPTAHLFSGLLRCGMCGGGMSVMSTKVKNGKRYVAYGCNVSRTKGEAICRNRVLVSELQLLAFVRDALKALPSRPEFQESFLEAFQATVAADALAHPQSGLLGALKAQEDRVARLVDAIADAGGSPALTFRLKTEEAKLESLRNESQAAAERTGGRRPPSQAMDAARAALRGACELLGRERDSTRAALVAMLEPMKLTPAKEAAGAFYDVEARIKIPANQEVGREVLSKSGCGGRI
jgi:site-specific DNA recombinase